MKLPRNTGFSSPVLFFGSLLLGALCVSAAKNGCCTGRLPPRETSGGVIDEPGFLRENVAMP